MNGILLFVGVLVAVTLWTVLGLVAVIKAADWFSEKEPTKATVALGAYSTLTAAILYAMVRAGFFGYP